MKLAGAATGAVVALAAILIMVAGASAFAQSGTQGQGSGGQGRNPGQIGEFNRAEPCEVAGSVVRSGDGTPLRGATVTLVVSGRRSEPLATRTDATGRFALRNVPAGSYRLIVERTGYARQEFGQRALGRRGVALNLSPGQRMTDLLFRMTPAGVITGRVFDEQGEPLVGVLVNVLRRVYREGRLVFEGGESDRSDDRGEYRIFNLMPGRYVVSATPVGGMVGAGVRRREGSDAGDETYVPTFYPGVIEPETAVPLEVSPGQELTGIDFTLTPQRTVRVRGRALAPGGGRGATQVALLPRSTRAPMRGRARESSVEPDGAFELSGVAPGSYILAAMRHEDNITYSAREPVEVGNSDVEGVTLALMPNGTVSGKVVVEGGALPESRVFVNLRPEDALSRGGNAPVQADGAFQIRNVSAGDYQVMVSGAPEDFYLKSVRRGNEVFANRSVPLLQDTAGLEVVLSPSGARVEGQVLTEENLPASGVTVVLVPARDLRHLRAAYRTASTDVTGQFIIRGIPPGDYTAYSWDSDEGEVWMDPDFLAQYQGKGRHVSLLAGGAQVLHLTLLEGRQ
jgi:hypothetical protein